MQIRLHVLYEEDQTRGHHLILDDYLNVIAEFVYMFWKFGKKDSGIIDQYFYAIAIDLCTVSNTVGNER